MLYLGIDQHRSQLTVNLRSKDGTVLLQRQVSTKWEKIRAFFADLTERAAGEGGFMAIVEVCGMNPWLIDMLQEYGCREIVVTQPEHKSKKKTDRRDAAFLSNLLWLNRQRLAGGQRAPGMRRINLPDIGLYSALAISSRIGDIERFRHPDSLANYWGLTPGCNNSGLATKRLGSITKQGSKMVRHLLGQAVVKVLRYDMAMRKWYKQIKKRRGSKIARVAAMRRMATIIWHMVKKNRRYEYANPIKKHQEFEQFSGEPQETMQPTTA